MSELRIVTNNNNRQFLYGYDIPDKVLEEQFDHLDEDEKCDNFIKYRNNYYHISDFMRIEHNENLKGWDGYLSDSYFSGILIKLSEDDNESYKIATYYA